MRRRIELTYMARDLWRLATHHDYFHQPQELGMFFQDERCYYNDLRGKSRWLGEKIDGIPALYIPSWGRSINMPVMVAQFGLGCLDCYLLERSGIMLENVQLIAAWVAANIRPDGSFVNYFQQLDPNRRYYSDNNAMVQGEYLSFITRAVKLDLINTRLKSKLADCARLITANMLTPLDEGGTASYEGEDLILYEYCRMDDYRVLNGWVFAIFGLFDQVRCTTDAQAETALNKTLNTLTRLTSSYIRPDGWTLYDNKGRICSPFYHALHVSLFDALSRLTGIPEFRDAYARMAHANSRMNRLRFTIAKIKDKLHDTDAYATQA